jgi:hypothetical protein
MSATPAQKGNDSNVPETTRVAIDWPEAIVRIVGLGSTATRSSRSRVRQRLRNDPVPAPTSNTTLIPSIGSRSLTGVHHRANCSSVTARPASYAAA